MSTQVSYKKQTLLMILLGLVLLASIEGAVRIHWFIEPPCNLDDRDAYDEFDFEIKRDICLDHRDFSWGRIPNLYMVPDQHLTTININKDGFRGTELSENANNFRIFIIGGSTVFGTSSSDKTTIPGILQELINEDENLQSVEVINAGMNGAFSYTEKKYIEDKIINLEPDLLIIYDGMNDLTKPFSKYNETRSGNYYNDFSRDILDNHLKFWKTPFFIQWFLTNDLQALNNSKVPFNLEKIDEKTAIWSERWQEVCTLGKNENFDTVVILQPLLPSSKKTISEDESKILDRIEVEKYNLAYQKYADKLSDLDNVCTKTMDLRGIFDNEKKPIFSDTGHMADYGNSIVAKEIFDETYHIIGH